jgi:hypothetical protein
MRQAAMRLNSRGAAEIAEESGAWYLPDTTLTHGISAPPRLRVGIWDGRVPASPYGYAATSKPGHDDGLELLKAIVF